MGLFSSKSSSSSAVTNQDQRVVADGGSVGLSGNNSTFNVLDGGIVSRAMDSLDTNFKLVQDGAGEGLSKILGLTENLFGKQLESASSMASTVQKSVADAYSQASSDAKGTIDNRTMIMLAGVAVVGLFFIVRKRA